MKLKHLLVFTILAAPLTYAQTQNPSSGLTIEQYLEQVRTRNGEVHATIQNVRALEMRLNESEVPLVPEVYAQAGYLSDQKETPQPQFMGDRTIGKEWRAGLRKQTTFGLGADLYFKSRHTNVRNLPATFESDYRDNWATLELTQSLWRNAFGEGTRAQIAVGKANTEIQLLSARFQLKNLMLQAENTYWALVSYQEIVRLQRDSVERGQRLNEWMKRRTKLRLYDDVDSMQVRAALEMRELELQTSLDEQASMVRRFNTLRGVSSDQLEDLQDLPNQTGMLNAAKVSTKNFTREDFEILRVQARAAMAQATAAATSVKPKVDLMASFSTTGHDINPDRAKEEVQTTKYPVWQVGVSVAVPLDFGLMRDIKRSQRVSKAAAKELETHAQFSESRAWEDFNKQKTEALGRYQRSISLEKLQTQLVKSERQRLLNGRTTTFQLSTFENNLAGAQVQRIRAQLSLLQLHNVLKQFQERQ